MKRCHNFIVYIVVLICRLLEEVLDCQRSYNSLLKKTLEDQKDQANLLKLAMEQKTTVLCSCFCREFSHFDHENSVNSDEDLVEWLRNIGGIDEHSIKKVILFQNIIV